MQVSEPNVTRPVKGRVGALLRMPPGLKAAVVNEVKACNTNTNDVVVGALAERYGFDYLPSNRHGEPSAEKLVVLLRMCSELKLAIQLDALDNGSNLTATVVPILLDRFRVAADLPLPTRKTPFGGGKRKWS
jgi:hypothetical protein